MTYAELKKKFREHEKSYPKTHLTAHIVFTEDSWDTAYPLESRTYIVSSHNKAFMPNMGGYSIYGGSLDGTDPIVRLEQYMADELGGKNGWKVEDCKIVN